MGNSADSGNSLLHAGIEKLSGTLPAGWRLALKSRRQSVPSDIDGLMQVRGPDSTSALVLIETKSHVEPKSINRMAELLRPGLDQVVLVVAPFLSSRAQERLREFGFQYADLTGNVRFTLSKPGLYIETRGSEKNPEPSSRERRSLKGAKAGRLIRALCDFRPPLGLRELAMKAQVDAGYASRLIDFLDSEALITRKPRGPITNCDWSGLLRRWSQQYSPLDRTRVRWFLAARGLPYVIEKLRTLSSYVVTGSWAATQFAPIAAPRLLMCYAVEPSKIINAADLKPAQSGSNVALLTPFDPVVFERTLTKAQINVAAPSQIVADLLTSPGRGPNEAEELMAWMRENENAWRT
jgi:hypothetical protein